MLLTKTIVYLIFPQSLMKFATFMCLTEVGLCSFAALGGAGIISYVVKYSHQNACVMAEPQSEKKILPFWGKASSHVWTEFGFYIGGDGKIDKSKAVCKNCRKVYAYNGESSTSPQNTNITV